MNSTNAFEVTTLGPAGHLDSRLSFDESGLTGTITNRLGFDIAGAVITVNRRTYKFSSAGGDPGQLDANRETTVSASPDDLLGRIEFAEVRPDQPAKPGPTKDANAPADNASSQVQHYVGIGEFTPSLARSRTDSLRKELLGQIVNVPGYCGTVHRGAMLIGYTDEIPVDPLPGRDVKRQGWSVVVWPLTLAAPPTGQRVRIPSGFVELEYDLFPRILPIYGGKTEEFRELQGSAGTVVYARPPSVIRRLTGASAELRIDATVSGFDMEVYGLTKGKKRPTAKVLLDRFTGPKGVLTVRVPDADRFQRADGSFAFYIYFSKPATEKLADKGLSGKRRLNSVDVGLEGINK